MGNSKLKLVSDSIETQVNQLYISKENNSFPYLAYQTIEEREVEGGESQYIKKEVSVLGGSSSLRLIRCSELASILKRCVYLGTRYVIKETGDLYYNLPSIDSNLEDTKSDPFIPVFPASKIDVPPQIEPQCFSRVSIDSSEFSNSTLMRVKISSLGWEPEEINGVISGFEAAFLEARKNINFEPDEPVPHKIDIDYSKETRDSGIGKKAEDIYTGSVVIELVNSTCYTDTVDFSPVIERIKEGEIYGKADVTILYSKNNRLCSFSISFEAFEYATKDELKITDQIIDRKSVQVEYFNGLLRVFPKSDLVNECIISDCIITYGKL